MTADATLSRLVTKNHSDCEGHKIGSHRPPLQPSTSPGMK